MPRPQRIEYENAFYHVMNRGRGRQTIFHDETYYRAFINTLVEARKRFNCVIHAYCLMNNHYHLLIETPDANLSRVMRHINGVYTQRHNRLKGTDGTLFRGRFKAILVEQDAYLLQLSRYIHRNPVDMNRPLVKDLADYPWSSYPAYVNKVKQPEWLYTKRTYEMLGKRQRYKAYANFVEQGVDDEMKTFYNKGNQPSVLGDSDFKSKIANEQFPELPIAERTRIVQPNIPMEQVTKGVAKYFKTTEKKLRTVNKGPTKGDEARKLAMYLCQELSGVTLREIAEYFGLKHIGSVSFITHQIRKEKQENRQLDKTLGLVIDYIMKQVT